MIRSVRVSMAGWGPSERSPSPPPARFAESRLLAASLFRRGQATAHLLFAGGRIGTRGRRVGLMELDVAAAGPVPAQRARGHEIAVVQADPEPVVPSRLPVVLHAHPEANRLPRVGPGEPADVARVGKGRVRQVPRDLGAVDMIGGGPVETAVVHVVHVPPEAAVLAPAVRAEVCALTVVPEDESAARDEVAGSDAAAGAH